MYVLAASTFVLIILLFLLKISTSSVLHSRPFSEVPKPSVGNRPWSNHVHNATVNCGNITAMRNTVIQCHRDLSLLVDYGYPWSHHNSQRNSRNSPNAADRNNTLRDAMDSLNHVCSVHDRSRTCLKESGIRDNCLATIGYPHGAIQIELRFICHHQQRDENLVHSLQCLHDTRVLAMLYFHIADRCRGFGILDDIMRRYKNAYFYRASVNPVQEQVFIGPLYCLPKSVISTCIRDIVEDHCGVITADLVQNYLYYLQHRYSHVLKSATLDPSPCDHDISFDMGAMRMPNPSGHTRIGITRWLQFTAPGTALDTVWGKYVMAYLHSLSGEDLCHTANAGMTYGACVMSSDDASDKTKFNILQFAHQQIPLVYHGSRCGRLEYFEECWNLLQDICGQKVRGLEQHATLLVEGCKVQSEMEITGCHWQDILLPHYIQASRVTVWPLGAQCLGNPMFLDGSDYRSYNDVVVDLKTLISLIQPGVEEISRQCGPQPAKRLRLLLSKLRYLQRDALKFTNSILTHI